MDVCIVRTGVANMASVMAGLRRAGATPHVSDLPEEVESAEAVVLPGVGAFGAGMGLLGNNGLIPRLQARVRAGRPTLAVCLGLQLLLDGSDESPGVEGLGLVAGRATRFPPTVRVPQMGWNRVEPQDGCELLRPGTAYFANSYRLESAPEGWACARTEHAGPFVSALERGAVLACQFHPELSGRWGLELLGRWLERARAGSC